MILTLISFMENCKEDHLIKIKSLDILKINNRMIDINFIELLTDCLLNSFIINSSVFIIEKDIDYIINKYKILFWNNST